MSRVEWPSVGSRVSWGAILAGVVVAFAIYFLLSLLGTAVGLSVYDRAQPDTLRTGGAIWSIVVVIFALFVGGWVTSRFTVGEDRLEAVLNGAIVWGVSFLLLFWVVSIGMSMGYTSLVAASSIQAAPGAAERGVVLNADVAARTAWWTFVGTILSMAGAIGGAVVGTAAGADVRRFEGRPMGTTRTTPTP